MSREKYLVEQTSLSRFTVSRGTKDLSEDIKETLKERLNSCEAFSLALDESTDINDTSQLVIFIRAVTAGFDVFKEFLDMASLSSTTTGQDICEQVLKVVEKFELNPYKLCGVTTDGAPSMTGRTNGFTKKFLTAIGAQDVVVSHCIIHQESLCTKVLDFPEVMKNVVQCVNYIRTRGLNHRQFKTFLDELDSEYSDVLYFSAVRWLSRVATLKRFWNLREEMKFFMESKRQNVDFLSNENWLNDLAFLTDITQHLSDLNLKLQGKSQLVNKLFEHICAFEKKLELFQVQLRRAILTHFTCLATRKLEFPNLDCTKYGTSVQKLRDEFANRFPDFRQTEIRLKLFAQPFDLAVEDSPDDCQMELIELQADMDTKRKFSENSLLDFYKLCVHEKFPNLSRHAQRIASLFGSTYCCEQFFSKMKLIKTKCRSQLTDEHLTSQLRVATTSVKADIDKFCKDSKFQVLH
ncbi:general transcription factor II-I repeat domain-containing protein 2B-like [Tachypleus tridentatus]|uniref:general transcription factor II-I repeat domain-containing protein 2B-like n=1 Tax=Tachypleus tridentatus TaxID=6853 RepID=UPI003FCFDFCC